ncbi:Autoinducer 2 sensor kinase/phosphatase LuxQ [Roseimaritima ulvae]|uniref:Autoinducer 2 sensor kinase/phosphatase LuxQ n=2 Tax=Roseimaritima ulvae TaxID=980254 RepID=A0A5B9R0P8_9BACT|nr:Autoinducer 2 sensor kinase/phosphatase LuxQ [Roseimaritima ulvae]
MEESTSERPVVVGVGASAGGLDALMRMFSSLPDDPPMSFVVVQHLDPTHDSALTEILQRKTALRVQEVRDEVEIQDGCVYVIPPNKYLSIEGCVLKLTPPTEARGARMSIDYFFRSLAEDLCEYAVGVLLSGTGTDGTAGLKEIKMCGGLTVVQQPHDAEHVGMPQSAINALDVDFKLTAEQIGQRLVTYVQHARQHSLLSAKDSIQDRDLLDAIIRHLKQTTGADFRRYRRSTIARRIRRRMGLSQLASMQDYLHLLKDDTRESATLKTDLLIGVTRFFRNPEAWQALESELLQPIIEQSDAAAPIRIWCAGCATGEEVYSLAMLCHENAAYASKPPSFQIFATDVSAEALSTAREGMYPESVVSDLTSLRLQQFFCKDGNHYQVSRRLRESIVFTEQNVLSHPPFSQLDLIVCRNLLIYLDRPAQRRVLDVFQFALKEDGGLFLGSSESTGDAARHFLPINKRWRLFKRTATSAIAPMAREVEPSTVVSTLPPARRAPDRTRGNLAALVQRQLIREADVGIAVINVDDRATYLQGPVDQYLRTGVGELGGHPPFIMDIVREGLRSKIRPLLRTVRESFDRHSVDGRVRREGRYHPVRVVARPLRGQDGAVLVSFMPAHGQPTVVQPPNVRPIKSCPGDLAPSAARAMKAASTIDPVTEPVDKDALIESLRAEIGELTHELDTTRQQLSTTIEDLETTNEELQAANEESMAVNEELQAGNEELETSKEELQSLNEELVTLNNQLEIKLHQLQETTDDLNNLLLSTHLPTVFVDTHLRIRRFTPSATKLFHLIASDTGRPLSDIRANFDTKEVFHLACEVLESSQSRNCDVGTSDGKSFLGRLQPYRTEDNHIRGVVITFSDVTDLRKSKQVAQNRLAELETIYESTPIGLSFIGKDRTFRSINHRLAEVNGVPVEQTLGKTLRDVLPAPLVDEVEAYYERVFSSGQPIDNVEIVGQTAANEQPHQYRVSYHPVFAQQNGNNEVIGVNSVVEDVTDLRRMELELSTSEERLRQIAEASDYVFWITQVDPEKVLYVSPAYEEVWGRKPDELLKDARHWTDAIHPDDQQRVSETFERFLGEPDDSLFEVEYRIVRNGEIRWIADRANAIRRADGSVNRVAGIARDITATKQSYDRLEISEGRARLAIDLAKIGVIEVDYETDTAVLDEFAADTFGLPAAVPIPRRMIHERFHPKERDGLLAKIERFIDDSAETVDSFEHRIVRRDGKVRWVRASKRVYYETVGTQTIAKNTVVAVLDFTEQHEQQDRLAQARDAAEAANRSRGEFLANMSHEIRTPMTAILGHAEILNDHLTDPDNLSVVETIRRNGRHLLDIINDILDLSKIDAGKLEVESRPVRPDAIVGEIRSLMDVRAAEKHLPLKVEFAGPVPEMIDTDPVRLRQVLLNLVGNAIKFTDEGEVRFVVRYDESNRVMQFDVIDTGLGIGSDKLESLFEPFTQADATNTRSTGGTGLGLTICRRLAHSLGGDIRARSEPGKGSRFSLVLNVQNGRQLIEPNLNREPPCEDLNEQIRLSCSVLIVDDRRDIRYLAQHFIEKAGGEVHTATNGREAVDFIYDDDQPHVDVIVLDMQMPVMDGYEAAAELRRRGCELPIIALTANAMKEDRDRCLAAGCTDYTTKPLDKNMVIRMIDRLVRK